MPRRLRASRAAFLDYSRPGFGAYKKLGAGFSSGRFLYTPHSRPAPTQRLLEVNPSVSLSVPSRVRAESLPVCERPSAAWYLIDAQ